MAYRKYDQQLKDTVIEEVIIGERSVAQVAQDHEMIIPFQINNLRCFYGHF